MKNKYEVSIIIPVYNVEKYLKKCLDSVVNQKEVIFEVLLVNDGSTDNSKNICELYAKKYKNVKIINQKNEGVSSARNKGIEKASGKYLMFMDSDDFLLNDYCLMNLRNSITLDYDIVIYNMVYTYDNELQKIDYLPKFPIINKEDNVIDSLIKNNKLSISACDKWVKRELLIDNKIFFNTALKNLEDADWSLNLYGITNNILVTNEYVYVYRKQRMGSASSTISDNVISQHINFIEKWFNKSFKKLSNNSIRNYLSYQYVILLGMISKNKKYTIYKTFIKDYKGLLAMKSCLKVKIAYIFSKTFGLYITSKFLALYLKYRENGGRLL